MEKKQKSRIIWAVDPFQDSRGIRSNSVSLLRALTRKNSLDVEPVYISSPNELNVALEFSVPAATRFHEVALKQLQGFLVGISSPKLLAPKVIVERNPSISVMAINLAKYAANQRASLVVLGTQSRSSVGHFFLGSFAETFLFHSKIPVVLLKQNSKKVTQVKRILFPTDFSPASKKAFTKLCQFAGQIGAAIIVHHVIRKPEKVNSYIANQVFGSSDFVSEFLNVESRLCEREAERFVRLAKKLGVSASLVIESSSIGIDKAILVQAKRSRADMIGLASQSGQLKASFFGSVARKVIRNASTPLWIAHSM